MRRGAVEPARGADNLPPRADKGTVRKVLKGEGGFEI